MNKKWMTVAALGVGAALLVSSGLTASAGTSGYEAYKSALKEMKDLKSAEGTVVATLSDNGSELVSATSTFKSDHETRTMSTGVKLASSGQEMSFDIYSQSGMKIVKAGDSDVYHVRETGKWKPEEKDDRRFFDSEDMENVVDALLGNLSAQVTLEETSEGREVALNLKGSQIPAVVNMVGSMAVKRASEAPLNEHHAKLGTLNPVEKLGLENKLPKLTQDVTVEAVQVTATISDDNRITNQTAKLTVTGKDGDGQAHQLTLNVQAALSGFDSTTPEKVDLTGKKTETLELPSRKHRD